MIVPSTLWVLLVTAPCNAGQDTCTDAPSVWLSLEDCRQAADTAADTYPDAVVIQCDRAETDPGS